MRRRHQRSIRVAALMFFALNLLRSKHAFAGTASPLGFRETQPDGTQTPMLFVRGDHVFNYMHDSEGFTVIRDSSGWYVYAVLDQGESRQLVPSRLRVGKVNPTKEGLKHQTLPPEEELMRLRMCDDDGICDEKESSGDRQLRTRKVRRAATTTAREGNLRNLVVLVKFSDYERGKYRLPSPRQIHVLMNSKASDDRLAPTGSVQSAYKEYSYGKAQIESKVTPWIRVDQGSDSNRAGLKQAFLQALDVLQSDLQIDAKEYQSIIFLHSSYGAEFGATDCFGTPSSERVWAHSSSLKWKGADLKYGVSSALWGSCGSDIARIGMICHELGHALFRLRDLYDKSSGWSKGVGIGAFDFMAYAWGKDNTQYYPPHPSAWTKIQLGWVKPTIITRVGDYTLLPTQTVPQIYRIEAGFPTNEYLLLENRQAIGLDKALGAGGGLAIYHIDDEAPGQSRPGYPTRRNNFPFNGDHYQVALAQADRNFHLERGDNVGELDDLWAEESFFGPGGNNIFEHTQFPNSDTYQNGQVKQTGIRIFDIEQTGKEISFRVSGWYLSDYEEDSENVKAPPVDGKKREHEKETNEKEPNIEVNTCRDERSYRYTTTYGDRYDCEYARTYKHVCRRRDKRSGKFLWQHCKASCRSYFLNLSRAPFDICAKK